MKKILGFCLALISLTITQEASSQGAGVQGSGKGNICDSIEDCPTVRGPQGPRGPVGPRGPAGPQGPAGTARSTPTFSEPEVQESHCPPSQYGTPYTSEGKVVHLGTCQAIRDEHTGCIYRLVGFQHSSDSNFTRGCFKVTSGSGVTLPGQLWEICASKQDIAVGPPSSLECQTTIEVLKASAVGISGHVLVAIPKRPE